ncbi:uncharacterized protein V1510DRAFT_417676 [Dipodascopsis tothii]|uniref:uncharacterized protein n=1 Tax=Dipodascopsis tothii TaxID=44089 RepID=UPI0034CFC7CB
MAKIYPRATLKKIVKGHQTCKLSKNADILIYLDYILFINELVKTANLEAHEAGDKVVRARHLQRVAETTLQKFRG